MNAATLVVIAIILVVIALIEVVTAVFAKKIGPEFDFFFSKIQKRSFLRLFTSFLIFYKWKRLKFC